MRALQGLAQVLPLPIWQAQVWPLRPKGPIALQPQVDSPKPLLGRPQPVFPLVFHRPQDWPQDCLREPPEALQEHQAQDCLQDWPEGLLAGQVFWAQVYSMELASNNDCNSRPRNT